MNFYPQVLFCLCEISERTQSVEGLNFKFNLFLHTAMRELDFLYTSFKLTLYGIL